MTSGVQASVVFCFYWELPGYVSFAILRNVQTGAEAHPASYSVGTADISRG